MMAHQAGWPACSIGRRWSADNLPQAARAGPRQDARATDFLNGASYCLPPIGMILILDL